MVRQQRQPLDRDERAVPPADEPGRLVKDGEVVRHGGEPVIEPERQPGEDDHISADRQPKQAPADPLPLPLRDRSHSSHPKGGANHTGPKDYRIVHHLQLPVSQ